AVAVAAPGSRATRTRKPTLAGRGLVAGADGHDYGAVLGDLAADVDGRRSPVAEVAVADAHRIAIGRIALAGLGHDHDAPEPVIARPGFGRLERGPRWRAPPTPIGPRPGCKRTNKSWYPLPVSCRAPPPISRAKTALNAVILDAPPR